MNNTQEQIKSTIEKISKMQYDIDVVVEYVADVSKRAKQLQQQFGEKLNSVYGAEHSTGIFIPAVNNNPYYILIQENRESELYVMTAFHEFKHLIDYVMFLKSAFSNNAEQLKNSPMYITFNIYSEYAATAFGVKNYIEKVTIVGMTQKELAESIFQNAKTKYWDLRGIDNRYQLLLHSMQYMGNIIACSNFIDDVDFQKNVDEMELSDELYPTFKHIFKFENKYEWYRDLDKIMREFVDGGVKS